LDLLAHFDFNNNGNPFAAVDLSGNSPAASFVGPAAYTADARLTDNAVAVTKITTNAWQHFVFQKDAAGRKEIWINGVLALSQASGETGATGPTTMFTDAFSPAGPTRFYYVVENP
jgi:hypothetical protein